MQKIKINETQFSLEKQNYKFLDEYIKRLKKYCKSHTIDQELYNELLIRLEEKLTQANKKKQGIIQKDCVNIINELGEPEEIFDIEEDNTSPYVNKIKNKDTYNKSGTFFQKVYGDILLFWGIFLFFAIATGLNVFILLFMIGFIIFIIYLFREKKRKSIRHFVGFLRLAIKRAWKNILTIARILFFCGGGLILLGGALIVIIGIGVYFSDFSIENMKLFAFVPTSLPIGGIFGAIALILFGLFFIHFGIRKKGIGNLRIIIASISMFAGILFGTIAGFSTFSTYLGEGKGPKSFEKTTTSTLSEIRTDITYDITILYPRVISENLVKLNPQGAEIKASNDNTIKVITQINRYGPAEMEEILKQKIFQIEIYQHDNIITIGYKDQKLFTEKVPFVPLTIKIKEIYIPKNITFNTSFGLAQINLPQNLEKYEPYININHCETSYYDEKREIFSCNINEERIEKLQLQNIIYPLTWKTINNLSPIKHQEENKRTYYSDWGEYYSDWNIKNIDREGDTLTIIYADQSLTITATAKIEEKNQIVDEGEKKFPFVIQNFKIQKIIKNSKIYKDNYYQNPEKIKECEKGC